ncbi:MAG: long-chain fatty acid--CoA ligase [Bacteroidota bacterium]|nr:long-chain fatty acid--CoA ligase [Bacteroidota bacterium]
MTPTRLFDCIETHLKDAPGRTMLAGKENGQWKEYTTVEVAEIVNKLSSGLMYSGIGPGDFSIEGRDKVAVISKNRPEWVMLDLAVQRVGAVLVPVYPTISDIELEFILKDANVKLIFVNDVDLFQKANRVKANLPNLKEIISFEKIDGTKHWKDILLPLTENILGEIKTISDKIKSEDLVTIIYTSGTTGTPKGVMLSHKNILSNVVDSIPCFPPGENMRALSFLPLNHIFERMISFLYLFKGTSIFFAESIETIPQNLQEIQPDLFATVPRLLEKMYEKIMEKGSELKGIKRRLFFWAHSLGLKYDVNKNLGFFYNLQLSLANKLIFNKWREALGNNIISIISGGAACQLRLLRIFTAAKIPIMEGYGLTETSPVISVNRFEVKGRMLGTVGPLLENVEVKFGEDGEILCKGPNVMMGYYKHPEWTAECMQDGWFKTGDIGVMVGEFLKITDRKKEIFKTSGGKYVAPLAIENKLKESRFIENIMVVGAGEKFVGALIIPAFVNLRIWCKEHDIDCSDNKKTIANPQVIELYQKEIERYHKFFNHVEQVKKFELLSHDWTTDNGELTPKLSLRRKVIMEKNKEAISNIYSS